MNILDLFEKTVKIERRGYIITLPKKVYTELNNENLKIRIVLTKYKKLPSSVQVFRGNTYVCTLKEYMNVEKFKDDNVCNFKRSNLIYKK